jgi:hypothetical protein
MVDEGLEIVRAVRERYDGERRNPWNEFECGSNYVRSMASYALLLALSGFECDMTRGHMGFAPAMNASSFSCFWCLRSAWGTVAQEDGRVRLTVLHGEIGLSRLRYEPAGAGAIRAARLNGAAVPCQIEGAAVRFRSEVSLAEGDTLDLML